ncbi:MAG: DNA polymerase III subunit delta' [Methylococcales bacterium]|jgi:DNA polymerase III subunit delta'|nr:DNA polymerase III subunit delta' [Methylococcales bacterium]MBT7443625.1 DNA polymerase III subunit delta' [Methylococcales bacterium]
MDKPALYPWLQASWKNLLEQHKQGKLAHAYLLSGLPGLGKAGFARFVSSALLCLDLSEHGACGHCKTCHLLAADTLPDFYELLPEGKSQTIRIDQVRKLCAHLILTPQIASMKIAVIQVADSMNVASANSLLKTLEEPTADTLLILVTDFPNRLLPTIRSRCQQLHLNPPPHEEALQWLGAQQVDGAETLLSLTSGAPLAALRDSESGYLERRTAVFADFIGLIRGQANILAVSESWQKTYFPDCLYWLRSWVEDMIRLKMVDEPPLLENTDIVSDLKAGSKRLDLKALYARLSLVQTAIQQSSTTVNHQMLLDEVLYPWN